MKVFKPLLAGFSMILVNSCCGLANAHHLSMTTMPSASYDYIASWRYDPFHEQCSMKYAYGHNRFIEESHLNVTLQAGYLDFVNKDKNMKMYDWKQAALASMVDWRSGYANGWFGMNGSLYGGLRLHASGSFNFGARPMPYVSKRSLLKGTYPDYDQEFGRIGRLNAKVRFGNTMNGMIAHAGFIGADSEYLTSTLLAPESHRLTLTTERGVSIKSHLQSMKLYAAWWDRIANRTGDDFHHFSNGNGSDIDYVGVVGASYMMAIGDDPHALFLNAEFAEGKNYLQEYFGQGTYRLPLTNMVKMTLNGQYYYVRKDGNLWTSGIFAKAFDKNAHLANLNVNFGFKKWCVGGAYSKTKAEASGEGEIGLVSNRFYHSPAANYEPGSYFGTGRMESDFAYDDEDAYQISLAYDFSDFLKGLTTRLTHTIGENINDNVGIKSERETDFRVSWIVPYVQGLWVDLEDAYYSSERNDHSSFINKERQRYNDLRAWVNYQVSVF